LDLRHFQTLSAPVRSEIPVYLPAVFEKACELAGELADGLLSHPLWCDKWINSVVGDSISKGLAVSGRQRSELDINLMIFVAINEDKAQAIADARPTIAYYSQSPQYLRYFDFIGFGSEARAIQAAFAAGDMPAMIAACSDNMVEAIALVGSPDEVLKRLQQRTAIADSYTPAIPHYGLSEEQCSYYNNRLAELFYQ
jgi:alkanesulfonate monooxygenase SsuD/methylene tetrahydromethanopterin reductase-like flavin-dependent oxidoreductase (luciferase family)